MSYAISFSLDGIRRREAKVSDVGGIDGLRPLPTLYTAIAEIYRFRFVLTDPPVYDRLTKRGMAIRVKEGGKTMVGSPPPPSDSW